MVTTAGSASSTVSSPPSISRVTLSISPSISTTEAKVACGQPSSAASIWPVWLESSSIACLPRMTSSGLSSATTLASSLATPRGSIVSSVLIRRPRSPPMASAWRICSWAFSGPIETMTTSLATPFSFRRIASSTAISQKGFIDIFTLARSTPDWSGFTRTFTL